MQQATQGSPILRQAVAIASIAFALTLMAAVFPGRPASANTWKQSSPAMQLLDAQRAQPWGGLTINVGGQAIGIPAGVLFHDIAGSGSQIRSQGAMFQTPTGSVCNWSIDFVYLDPLGQEYGRTVGPVNYSCDVTGQNSVFHYNGLSLGSACAALKVNGVEIARQCHAVTA